MTTFRRYFFTPLITLSTIVLIYFLDGNTLVLPFAVFAIIAYFGGLRSNLIAAGLISLYAMYSIDAPLRMAQIIIGSFGLAIGSGWVLRQLRQSVEEAYRQKLAQTDRVDVNIARLSETLLKVDALLANRDLPTGFKQELSVIRVRIAEQLTLQRSYHIMAQEKGFVIANPE